MLQKAGYCLLILAFSTIGWIGSWSRLTQNGNVHYAEGEYDSALEAYQQAVKQRPDDAISHYNLGTALYQKAQFDKAANAFRHSLVATDSMLQARGHYNLGNAQFQLGDIRGAIRSYKNGLRSNPSDQDSKYNLELAFEKLKQQQPQGQRSDIGTKQQKTHRDKMPKQEPSTAQVEESEPHPMSKEDAIRLLETLRNDEKALWKKLLQKRFARHRRPEKDW